MTSERNGVRNRESIANKVNEYTIETYHSLWNRRLFCRQITKKIIKKYVVVQSKTEILIRYKANKCGKAHHFNLVYGYFVG